VYTKAYVYKLYITIEYTIPMTRTNGARVALLKLVTTRIYHKCT